MTIKENSPKGTWICTWFVNNKIEEYDFDESQLTDESPYTSSEIFTGKPLRNNHY